MFFQGYTPSPICSVFLSLSFKGIRGETHEHKIRNRTEEKGKTAPSPKLLELNLSAIYKRHSLMMNNLWVEWRMNTKKGLTLICFVSKTTFLPTFSNGVQMSTDRV